MRKLIMFTAGVTFLFMCLADGISGTTSLSENNRDAILKKYNKQIENLTKRAEFYRKKASQEENEGISRIYSSCADAKQKIADGYKQILENTEKCRIACESSSELKSVCNGGADDCLFNRKKGKRNSSYIRDINKRIELCREKAAQAEAAGKKELAEKYNDFADELKGKCKGLEMVSEGKKDFSNARKELKSLVGKSKLKK